MNLLPWIQFCILYSCKICQDCPAFQSIRKALSAYLRVALEDISTSWLRSRYSKGNEQRKVMCHSHSPAITWNQYVISSTKLLINILNILPICNVFVNRVCKCDRSNNGLKISDRIFIIWNYIKHYNWRKYNSTISC